MFVTVTVTMHDTHPTHPVAAEAPSNCVAVSDFVSWSVHFHLGSEGHLAPFLG